MIGLPMFRNSCVFFALLGCPAFTFADLIVGDGSESVIVRLEIADLMGNPISSIETGNQFDLRVFVMDNRSAPQGIGSVYMDVAFNPTLISSVSETIDHGPEFGLVPAGDFFTPGLIDEVGSITSNIATPVAAGMEALLFSTRFTADAEGTAIFCGDHADIMPLHATTIRGLLGPVPNEEIGFIGSTLEITVVPEPSAFLCVGLIAVVIASGRCLRKRTN